MKIHKETGCYSMLLKNGVEVLSINSMHFSKKNLIVNDWRGPEIILTWLRTKLHSAQERKRKLILTYHIPHGILSTAVGVEHFWRENYEQRFDSLLRTYKDNIIGIYTGHIHVSGLNLSIHDSFRTKSFYGGLIINRAVSPIYENNPGFSVYQYLNSVNYPMIYDEYSFDIEESYNREEPGDKFWFHLYNSNKDLGIVNLSAEGIKNFLDSLEADPKKYLKYILYRLGLRPYTFKYLKELIEDICTRRATQRNEYFECIDLLTDYMKLF